MEKILMKIQKYLVWAILICGFALLVTALAYSTDFWWIDDSFKNDNMSEFLDAMTSTNNFILYSAVVVVVLFAIMCIIGNKYRKKYYVSNLVAGCVTSGVGLILTIVCMIKNINVISLFNDYKGDSKTGLLKNNQPGLRYYFNMVNVDGKQHFRTLYFNFALIIQIICIVLFGLNLAFVIIKYIVSKKNPVVIEKNEDALEGAGE